MTGLRNLSIAGIVAACITGPASAQTVGIGSTKASVVAAMTAAISSVVSGKTDLKMRRQEMGGTEHYTALVDAGELEFGVSNIVQYAMARDGRVLSTRAHKNLQLVTTMMRFRTGFLVKNDSDIRRVEDLKGKRVAAGFKGALLFVLFHEAMLGTAGLTYDDVKKVPAVGLPQHWSLFKQGKIDTAIAGLAGAPNLDMNAKIPSGIRYLSFPHDTPAAKAALKTVPGVELELIQKAKPFVGIVEPAYLFGYDFMLFTNKNVPQDVVYKVAKAMVEGMKDLHATSPVWRTFTAERASRNQGPYDYHAGAMKFYREKGLWKR